MTKKLIILYFFILLKFVLHYFAIGPEYELHGDELLHLDLGKHLAWGYATVPPLIGWNSYLINLLGGSVFLIKFFPALFGALTIVVVWKTIEELKGNLFALVLGAVSVTFSVLLAHNVFYQPNCLDILLWTLIFFAIIKFINSEDNKWLWMVSISFAIGFLNKYNIVFLVLGLLPAILLTKHRKIFLNKHFYLSLLASIIIIFPNLLWQYNNDFPVFHHLQELTNEHLAKLSRLDFLVDQYFQFAGSFIVIILAFISFFRYTPFKKYTIFFWTYIFTISIYLYFNGKSYYTTGLYPILLAFGAVYLEKLLRNGWLQYLRPIVILLPILMVLYQLPLLVPFYSPEKIKQSEFTKTYNGGELSSSFASMLGWQELANLVDDAFDSIADKENTLIHCEWYGQAGAINYYSKQDYTEAVAFHADYINWYPLDEMEIKNVILVKHSGDLEKEKSLFKSVSFVGEVNNVNAQEYGTKVYILTGAKRSINELIRKQIQERKDNR
jgi:hypothetical protein